MSYKRTRANDRWRLQRHLQSVNVLLFLEILILCSSLKGELNLDKKWQSDDLFYIIMNKIHPRFNQFLRDFKVIVIYFKKFTYF